MRYVPHTGVVAVAVAVDGGRWMVRSSYACVCFSQPCVFGCTQPLLGESVAGMLPI